ncbi:MAG TPA: hypothetical protein VF544_03930 [Pyrinomonadaceae bacterium]|jgi:hypothetical protein
MSAQFRQPNSAPGHEVMSQPFIYRATGIAPGTDQAQLEHRATMQEQLGTLLEEIDNPLLRALMLRIFSDLMRLLDYLRMSEMALDSEARTLENISFFTLVHEEARALQVFIENQALRSEVCRRSHLTNALEGVSFALRHELKRVYEQELNGLAASESERMIRGRITYARGLLNNCFQQSLIILAQAFDQSLTGAQLFNDLPTRVEQSLILRRDLWTLVRLARRAEAAAELDSIIAFIQFLETFRHGSMHYLMYRDWQVYERFVDEVMATGSITEIAPVLNRFACYLETLFGQVRMRAVLANYPFDYSEVEV